MRDFMKGGLFCLFIAGLGACGLAAISSAVVLLVESPLFGTRQLEMLFALSVMFGTGLASSVLSAVAFAALEYVDHKFPAPPRPSAAASAGPHGEKPAANGSPAGAEPRKAKNSCS